MAYTNVNATLWVAAGGFLPTYHFIGSVRLDSLNSPQATVTLAGNSAVVLSGAGDMPWSGSIAVLGSAADALHHYVQKRAIDLLLLYGAPGTYADAESFTSAIVLEDAVIGSDATGVHNAVTSGGGAVVETVFTISARSVRRINAADQLHVAGRLPGCVVAVSSTADEIYALAAVEDDDEHALTIYWANKFGPPNWRTRALGSFTPPAALAHYALLPFAGQLLVNTGIGALAVEVQRSAHYRRLVHPVSGAKLATALRLWGPDKALIVTDDGESWLVNTDSSFDMRPLSLGSTTGAVGATTKGVLAVSGNEDIWLRQQNGRYVSAPLPGMAQPVLIMTDNEGAGLALLSENGTFAVTVDGGYFYTDRSTLAAQVLAAANGERAEIYAIVGNANGSSLLQSIDGGYLWRRAANPSGVAADLTCLHIDVDGHVLVGGQAASGVISRDTAGWDGFTLTEDGYIFWVGATEWALDKRPLRMV